MPHGTEGSVVVSLDEPYTVGHDFVDSLNYAVRGQAAVLDAEIHAAPGGMHSDAQLLRGRKLGAHQVACAVWKHIVMVETSGAAVLHQLAHTCQGGQADDTGVQVLPNLIQRFEPIEQLHILYLGQVAGKLLIKMVVGVDKARIAEHMAAIQNFIGFFVQICSDRPDDAVLTVKVRVLADAVLRIASHQLRNVLDQ